MKFSTAAVAASLCVVGSASAFVFPVTVRTGKSQNTMSSIVRSFSCEATSFFRTTIFVHEPPSDGAWGMIYIVRVKMDLEGKCALRWIGSFRLDPWCL